MKEELEYLKQQQLKEIAEKEDESPTGWHIVHQEKNALGLLKRENKKYGVMPDKKKE